MSERHRRWEECKSLLLIGLEELTKEIENPKVFFMSRAIYLKAMKMIHKNIVQKYGEGAELVPVGGRYFINQPLLDNEELPPAYPVRIRREMGIFEGNWYSQTASKWYRGYRRIDVTDKMVIPGQNEFRWMIEQLRLENRVDFILILPHYAYRTLPKT